MEFRQLRTLVAIADQGTFAAAGDYIGLTQSAVSLHIKALEEEFRTLLFDRSNRPPTLNAQGRALVERAREILDYCEQTRIAVTNDDLAGSLELGAVPTSLTGILPKALAALKDTHPKLQIGVKSGLSSDLANRVANGDLDAAVVTEPHHLGEQLNWVPFAREPLIVISSDDTDGKTDMQVLESQPYIQFSTSTWAGRQIERHLKDRKIKVVKGMEMDSLEAVGLMVSHGLGVSVVPLRCGEDKAPYGLNYLTFGDPPQYRVLGLLERKANSRALLVRALLATLKGFCSSGEERGAKG